MKSSRCYGSLRRLAVAALVAGACSVSQGVLGQNSFDIEDQTVLIGATKVEIPILVSTDDIRHALSFSLKYEQDKLELKEISVVGTASASASWSSGVIKQEDGEAVHAIIYVFNPDTEAFDENDFLAAGNNQVAAKLIVDILATEPTTATVEFMDDLPSFEPVQTKNRLTNAGDPVAPTLGAATITITEPGEGFKRGDSNANGMLDIGDPIISLGHQFLGDAVLCRDALDFNDTGTIDISDPVSNLSHQFLGLAPPAAPGKDTCGPDNTPDEGGGDLGCDAYPAENC